MKIKSIKRLKNYKSFNDFTWQPFLNNDAFHDDVNLFFGENGSGKSSICNILKSVSDNKEFGKCKPAEVCLVFDTGEKKYPVTGNWDSKFTKDSILFFDREFVSKNVHEYERKTTKDGQEQQSGKLIIEFDSDAINLRDARDKARKAKEEQEQKNKLFSDANKDLLTSILTEEDRDLFKKYKEKTPEEVENEKLELEKEKKDRQKNLDTDQNLQKKTANIKSDIKDILEVLTGLTLSDYESYKTLFDFDLKEKTKIEAEQSLVDKIKSHKSFFDSGIEIIGEHPSQCPFCQSEKEEVGIKKIVDLYNQIYDTTYKNQIQQFEKDKQYLVNELSEILKTLSQLELNSIFLELKRLDQNYKIQDIYSVEEENRYKKPNVKEIEALIVKISKLTKPTKEDVQDVYTRVESEVKAIEKLLKDVNIFVVQKNELIAKFKTDNTDEKLQSRIVSNTERIKGIEKELNFIVTDKISVQNKKDKKQKELQVLQNTLNTLETQYKAALKKYEDYCSGKAFSNLLTKIQDYFKNFNFSFKLELKTDPTGNKNEFPFAFKVLDLEGNERDFKDGLSEGEIQVLSLCFFFAFLDIQQDKKQKILVFDDPITSLDNSNLNCLVDLIADEQNNFSQIFIFTHHKSFFKFLRKRFGKHTHEYNLIRNKKEFGGSFICKSKSDKFLDKLKSFETDLSQIPPQSLDVELKVVEYGQYLRYEVERYIKNTLLHWDADQDFTLAIDGVKNNKLITDESLNKIKTIYSFCNWTTSHVDVGDDNGLGQLKQKISDFVAIVGV